MSDPKLHLTLSAKAPTDIWRKPPSIDVFNAEMSLETIKLSKFKSAEVTVSADWERLYDQGGLLVVFPQYSGQKQFWLKTGIEFYNGSAQLSVVSAREWADWSLFELPPNTQTVSIRIEREINKDQKPDSSLMVYFLSQNADGSVERKMVREVTWAFESEEGDLRVGVYAARPTETDSPNKTLSVRYDWSYSTD